MRPKQWDLVRGIRLVLAVIFLAAGIVSRDGFAFAAAFVLGAQAVLNIGCCGAVPCQSGNAVSPASELNKAVTYEEIK